MRRSAERDLRVFAWLTGQDDNIGDSVLRRGYAEALHGVGDVGVYIGGGSDDYVSGLGLTPRDATFSDIRRWLLAAWRRARRGPVVLAINAGEFHLTRGNTVGLLAVLPLMTRVRRGGGKVVWLGAEIPRVGSWIRTALWRRVHRKATIVRWRDSETGSKLAPSPWMPDWALSLGPVAEARPRKTLGVSLRFDRPYPDQAWLSAVRSAASRLDLDIVTIAQVKRDSEYARRLAADLGGRAVVYESGDHAAQEQIVREEYAGMAVLFSDRLHGLLMAATEGAVPLAWCSSVTDKIRRHLVPLGFTWSIAPHEEMDVLLAGLDTRTVSDFAAQTDVLVGRARQSLAEVANEIQIGLPGRDLSSSRP